MQAVARQLLPEVGRQPVATCVRPGRFARVVQLVWRSRFVLAPARGRSPGAWLKQVGASTILSVALVGVLG
eukprot:5423244-Lingulodinium_polyedra.AAC.1